MLNEGFHDVPAGMLAAVVTSLEMTAAPTLRAEPTDAPGRLHRLEAPSVAEYRRLYRSVGADWLWASRHAMADAELLEVIRSPDVELYRLQGNGAGEGMLELDFREEGQCELAFFGLSGPLVGTGAGRWLMKRALERAWARPIQRLWVHTCTLDHPAALGFYIRSGFRPFKRQVEVMADPRLRGLLPASSAAHTPLLP